MISLMLYYILAEDGKTPIPVDLDTYAHWWAAHPPANPPTAVGKSNVGDAHVSTVFLGHDHDFSGLGPPVLWETLVFGGANDQWMWRYSSYESALAGHNAVVAALESGTDLGSVEL